MYEVKYLFSAIHWAALASSWWAWALWGKCTMDVPNILLPIIFTIASCLFPVHYVADNWGRSSVKKKGLKEIKCLLNALFWSAYASLWWAGSQWGRWGGDSGFVFLWALPFALTFVLVIASIMYCTENWKEEKK